MGCVSIVGASRTVVIIEVELHQRSACMGLFLSASRNRGLALVSSVLVEGSS